MTAITAEQVTPTVSRSSSVTAPGTGGGVVQRVRRGFGPVALVAGPILGTAGMVIHPPGVDDDTALARTVAAHSGQWLASHLVLAIGWAALAVGLASVTRVARGPRGNLVFLGAALGTLGATIMSLADITHGIVAYALAGQVSPAQSIAIQKAYFGHPAIGAIMMGAMLLPAGVALLGAAVLRARTVPRWAGIVLLVSPLVVQAAGAAGPGEILCGVPLVVGTCALARAVARA